jgi:threonine synthase
MVMSYQSTRGSNQGTTFSATLMAGLADDGGLMMPASYPQIDGATLTSWRGLSYADLAFEVVSRFVDDIPAADLKAIVTKTYTEATYGTADIAPLKPLGEGRFLLALSNGPTLAFKDMAMQLLGNLLEYTLGKSGAQLNILGATSGDTGSAAEYAMRGKRGIRVFMMSPHERMSAFQTAQMFSLLDDNIFNIAIDGVFDDCQDMVKAVSNDLKFKNRYAIGTVNSINWARVVAQVVYYFKGYLAATNSNDQEVSFTVPSGNFGNVMAGHVARMMGLPIKRLVVATNENDVLDEFFRTGVYRPRTSRETQQTSSPSMDISKASNFERFVFDLMDRDSEKLAALWKELDTKGYFDLSDQPCFSLVKDKYGFVSGASNHAKRLEKIREIDKTFNLVVDTHTADGLVVAEHFQEAGVPMLCLETALPAKFSVSIEEALGRVAPRPAAFNGIESLVQKFTLMLGCLSNMLLRAAARGSNKA